MLPYISGGCCSVKALRDFAVANLICRTIYVFDRRRSINSSQSLIGQRLRSGKINAVRNGSCVTRYVAGQIKSRCYACDSTASDINVVVVLS